MPRRTDGLGADSRVPLRGLIDLFKNLTPGQKNIARSAFVDAEDLQNYFSRSVPERQNRRKISGRIQTINLEAESNLLGAFLKWNRIDDRRIAMYEVQLSDDNVFSNPETFQVLENFLVIENIRTIRYARVRGVTFAGSTGLFSNTATLRPRVSAPTVYSFDFYQRYGTDSDPSISKKLRYSGGRVTNTNPHPNFYTIFNQDFYSDRIVGGLSIWGSASARLKRHINSGSVPWDRFRFKVNGISRLDSFVPHWSINYDETDFHDNELDGSNPMTFYSRGGYTASFGPYGVILPNDLAGEGPNDPNSVVRRQLADGRFYWLDVKNAISASRFDQAQFSDLDDTINPKHEANCPRLPEDERTEWLVFRDFRFKIPSTHAITGIEAKIKRRQFSEFQNPIPKDNGNALVNLPFTTQTGLNAYDITEDLSFGRFLRFTDANDQLQTTSSSVPIGISNNRFTVAMWINNQSSTISTTQEIFTVRAGAGPTLQNLLLTRPSIAIPGRLRINFRRLVGGISSATLIDLDTFFNTNNSWIHLLITWNESTIQVFKNGTVVDTTVASGGTFGTTQDWIVEVGETGQAAGGAIRPAGISQVAIWNKVLGPKEIFDIVQERGFADLREEIGSYESPEDLLHYWLFIPDQADIRDHQVCLIDENDNILTTNNKAIDESWPRLSHFFYTDLRQYGFLPLAVSDGVPHDNHTAIGYQSYGDEVDLWGRNWTPSSVNSFYFGLAIRAKNEPSNGFSGYPFIDHAKLTVFHEPTFDRVTNVKVEVAAASHFYLEREIFGGLFNAIELGEFFAGDA